MQWLRKLFDSSAPLRLRLFRAALLGMLAAACAYRVWLVFSFNPMDAIWSDPGRHWTFGTRPLDTQPFVAIDPIGYQLYIGILAKLTAGSPVLVAYWTALLSLSGPWLWYRYLRELLPSRDWALVGWVILATLPSWSAIYSYFMQETLMLPLLGAALWTSWRSRRRGDTRSFVLAAAVWVLAGLTRGICIPLAAVTMTWLWFAQGEKLQKAALSTILLLAVLGPLAGRSWYLVRQVSPHGLATLNQLYSQAGTSSFSVDLSRQGGKERWSYEFMSPAMLVRPFDPILDWQSYRNGHAHFTIDLDYGSRDWKAAHDSLQPWDLERAIWLTGDNLINLFFSQSWPDSNLDRSIGRLNYWMRWIWAPLAAICLIWTVIMRAREKERLLPMLLLVWLFFQGFLPLAVNEGRYRKPFEGLLVSQLLLLTAGAHRIMKQQRMLLEGPDQATSGVSSRSDPAT